MSLIDANWAPQAAALVHGKKLSDKDIVYRKALYLEGLIRFLDIYAQTEIGGEIDLDIAKIALFTNSAAFENDDLYSIKSIDDVYKICEELTLLGLPLWRFLKLSDYQQKIFESGYNELLLSAKKAACDEKLCYGCIWYRVHETFLGNLTECKKPNTSVADVWRIDRKEPFIPENVTDCSWFTSLEKIPEEAYNLPNEGISRNRLKDNFLDAVEPARERFRKELTKDPFRIPKEMSGDEIIDLKVPPTKDDLFKDFGLAFKNKRTTMERRTELQRAMLIEGMIRFFEIYAQSEMGTDFNANIVNIALYADELASSELDFIKDYDDVYAYLEEMIISENNVCHFVKKSDYEQLEENKRETELLEY